MILGLHQSSQAFSCYFQSLGIGSRPCSPGIFQIQMMRQRSRPPRGLFITLEGIEGCGKSTQARLLGEYLRSQGHVTVETREPGGTPLAEKVRSVLLDRADEPVAAETEAFLVFAARRQHVAQVIEPALARGAIVLCDRFSDSTLAYQGYARGLDVPLLERLNRLATHAVTPHLTLLFDLPVATGLARRRSATELNRLDGESLRFHRKVRSGFLDLAKRHPTRMKVVPARASKETVARAVARIVAPMLHRVHRADSHTAAPHAATSHAAQVHHALR
ncbi:MAG: Thymidylate kinase [Nitrospira sp.]|nr:MAG: Thymidylate kinase [Nitrospira sp.]